MLIWLIIVPVIAAALIGLLKAPGRATALVSATFTLIMGVWAFISATYGGEDAINCWSTLGERELWFSLEGPLSPIMLLLSVIVTFAAILGLKAPDKDAERSWSIAALLLSTGAIGAFVSDNIISFYAFHELALIPTFVMIGFYGRGNRHTVAWTATVYLGLASMVLLAGLLMLCSEMRTYTFSGIRMAVQYGMVPSSCLIPGLLLVGFGTLVSLFPFHAWAAPAYASAPTPIAMLHAGVLKKFGLYGLFMLAYCMGPVCKEFFGCWNNLLLLLLLGNVLWVGYVTVAQTRLDDMLGNSSVMHMGYIFLAFAAYIASAGNNELAIRGAALLMLAHGLTIALLFLLTGQIESQTRTLELDSMGGLGRKLPCLGFLFGLAGLASIGLPLLANFAGEFTVFVSCFNGWQPGAAAATTGCDVLSNIYHSLGSWLSDIWLIGSVFGWIFNAITCTLNTISGWFGGLGPVQLATLFALWGLVISAIYMLRAFRRVFEGNVGLASERATALSCSDKLSAAFLAFFIVLFGVAPFLIFIY
ncbi:MAG: proton-conducting transporter membrane subunit [Akkermansia sp.]|nr:proton-conducting transporter membrane subunit [Akkermansia sp.]